MTHFADTDAAAAFVATHDSRETSIEIMQAIVFFADSAAEAEALWDGNGFGVVCHPSDLWEHVTNNGLQDAKEFYWGGAGCNWWGDIQDAV